MVVYRHDDRPRMVHLCSAPAYDYSNAMGPEYMERIQAAATWTLRDHAEQEGGRRFFGNCRHAR